MDIPTSQNEKDTLILHFLGNKFLIKKGLILRMGRDRYFRQNNKHDIKINNPDGERKVNKTTKQAEARLEERERTPDNC